MAIFGSVFPVGVTPLGAVIFSQGADTAGKWPYAEDLTSDFVYLRLHGDAELYTSGYSDAALDRWCTRIKRWSTGGQPRDAQLIAPTTPSRRQSSTAKIKPAGRARQRDIYCYFDNDVKVRAPYDARQLLEKLQLTDKLTVTPGEPMEIKP